MFWLGEKLQDRDLIKMTFVVWSMFVSSPVPSVWQQGANFSCWLWRLLMDLLVKNILPDWDSFVLPTQSLGQNELAVRRNEDNIFSSNTPASGGNSSSGTNLHIQVEEMSESNFADGYWTPPVVFSTGDFRPIWPQLEVVDFTHSWVNNKGLQLEIIRHQPLPLMTRPFPFRPWEIKNKIEVWG